MPTTAKSETWLPSSDISATATIGDLMGSLYPKWMWAHCLGGASRDWCDHHRPIALAQFAILWGLDASSDLIRERLVCGHCGHKGVMLTVPSNNGLGVPAAFPGDRWPCG